jgi:HD-like signal output (HDOD) protein
MLRNDDEDLAEKLGSIISNDQSLSVKILTLANSACYGHRAQIGTIKTAVVVIGTSMLRQFSLGVLVSKGLGRGPRERENFWRHSLMAANAAGTNAKRCIEAAVGVSQGQFKDIVRELLNRKAEIHLLFR